MLIANCHLYENSGVGLFLDDVNLHQINVTNCHVSYNREGGIVVREGNVRNLQVTGCDLEANMPDDEVPTKTANILLDVSGSQGDRSKSIAEVAITGCTIQHSANYSGSEEKTTAPGGANIRLLGKEVWPIDSVAITGNVMSDTTTNVHLDHSMDVTLSGNTFFAPKPGNLTVTNSQRVVLTGNTFNPRQFERPGTILFANSQDCVITGCTLHQCSTDGGTIVTKNCSGFLLSGLSFSDCGSGIVLQNTKDTTIVNCRTTRSSANGMDLRVDSQSRGILLSNNYFDGQTDVDPKALVSP